MQQSMNLEYEPAWKPQHISVKWLYLIREVSQNEDFDSGFIDEWLYLFGVPTTLLVSDPESQTSFSSYLLLSAQVLKGP